MIVSPLSTAYIHYGLRGGAEVCVGGGGVHLRMITRATVVIGSPQPRLSPNIARADWSDSSRAFTGSGYGDIITDASSRNHTNRPYHIADGAGSTQVLESKRARTAV